ncbi:MAG: histidine kinase [Bacteroidia bacterium]
MRYYLRLWVVLFTFFTSKGYSQIAYNFDLNAGFPSLNIYDICLDNNNVVWLASDNGVCSFNGYNVEKFSVENNDVLFIMHDNENRLWGVNSSAQPFYIKDGKTYDHHNTLWIPQKLSSIVAFMVVYNEKLYVGHGGNLMYLEGNVFKQIDLKLVNRSVCDMWVSDNNLYVVVNESLFKINSQNQVQELPEPNFLEMISKFEVGDSRIYMNESGIYLHKKSNQSSKQLMIFDDNISFSDAEIFRTQNEMFVFVNQKLYKYDFATEQLKVFFDEKTKVTNVVKDAFSNYWVTTFETGLFLIPSRFQNIKCIDKFDVSQKPAISFFKGKADIVGLNDGSFVLNNQLIKYNSRNRCLIRDYLEDEKGCYIASDGGLYRIDYQTKKTYMVINAAIKDLSKGDDGIFVATNHGVYHKALNDESHHFQLIYSRRVYCLSNNLNGLMLGSGLDGLIIYEHNQMKPVQNLDVLKNKPLMFMHLLPDNKLITVSNSNELNIVDIKTDKIIGHYMLDADFRINHVTYNKNQLIISSLKGILILTINADFSIKKNQIYFNDKIFNSNIRYLQVIDNDIYFINDIGIYVFQLKNIPEQQLVKPIVYAVKTPDSVYRNLDNLKLKSKYSEIVFTIFDPSYSYGNFLYKAENSSKDWFQLSTNTVRFHKPGVGKYSLFFAQSVGDKLSPTEGLGFLVVGPLHEYLWFQLIISIIILGLITYAFFRSYRLRMSEKHLQREVELIDANHKIISLQSQMNPHFLRNCMSSIQSLIYQGQRESANKYLNQFTSVIEQFIDHSKDSFVPLDVELKNIEDFVKLEQLRFPNKFEYQLILPSNVSTHHEIPTMFL